MSTGSIGRNLLIARKARGLSPEDAAFFTHIPAGRLTELENDDYSGFANRVYAKGFIRIYSRFLGIDLSRQLDAFDTSDPDAPDPTHEKKVKAPRQFFLSAPPRRPRQQGRMLAATSLIMAGLAIAYINRLEANAFSKAESSIRKGQPRELHMTAYADPDSLRPGPGMPQDPPAPKPAAPTPAPAPAETPTESPAPITPPDPSAQPSPSDIYTPDPSAPPTDPPTTPNPAPIPPIIEDSPRPTPPPSSPPRATPVPEPV
jgi:cytoskeletal protein RodZ